MLTLASGAKPSFLVAARHITMLSPISDVRASEDYRREAAIAIIGEALDRAAGVI